MDGSAELRYALATAFQLIRFNSQLLARQLRRDGMRRDARVGPVSPGSGVATVRLSLVSVYRDRPNYA
jgi:hypothetical protein